MPSPIGHALGAVAAGWTCSGAPPGADARRPWREAAVFATVGLLPDLDLLVGAHSQYTHSLGAVATVYFAAWLATRCRSPRMALAVALAYASHPLLDWLGQDGTPPLGVMLLWPLDSGFHHAGVDVFTGISRRYWLPGFLTHNLLAVAREVVILGPIALGAWLLRRRREGT